MKHTRKLASLLLALVMVLGLAATAFAVENTTPKTYSITINNPTEHHTYEAYQIFAGDLEEKKNEQGIVTERILSNIVWGTGIGGYGQIVLQDKYVTAGTKSAAGVAEALDDGNAVQFAKDVAGYLSSVKATSAYNVDNKNYTISGLTAGYYLVKDQDNSLTVGNDSYTEYIVKVVSDTTATPKSSVPTVEKKVKDINNSTETSMSNWQDSADHDIGDSVPFQLKATLANNVSSYTTYKVVFHDTLFTGLTYNNDAKVYINGTETNGFTVEGTKEGALGYTKLTVSCNDVKALGAGNSSVITVEYSATLNTDAVIGSEGNINQVYLEYSNNPNKSEAGDNETVNTPGDVVKVFTYKTTINKVDSEHHALAGAAFKLEKWVKGTDGAADSWTIVKEYIVDENNPVDKFEFVGLDDGKYKLTETVTPAGYNTIAPIEFTVTARHQVESYMPSLTFLSGDVPTGKITFITDGSIGFLSTDVVNNSGTQLPSTGGIGTTIFYVLGSVLVLAAVVLLVTKKRMSTND